MSDIELNLVRMIKGCAKLNSDLQTEDQDPRNERSKLSQLEHDVLWRLSIGDTKEVVAEELSLSQRTIDLLIESATSKLGASSPIHAVAILLRNGELGVIRYRD